MKIATRRFGLIDFDREVVIARTEAQTGLFLVQVFDDQLDENAIAHRIGENFRLLFGVERFFLRAASGSHVRLDRRAQVYEAPIKIILERIDPVGIVAGDRNRFQAVLKFTR